MEGYESFAQCLQRLLNQEGLSVSAAARLVGFRSRNSLFRILGGETSAEVDARFLASFRRVLGDQWPVEHWRALETALDVKRMGRQQYADNCAFVQGMYASEHPRAYLVEVQAREGVQERPLEELLREICREGAIRVVICGCCERGLTALLTRCMSEAGAKGRLTVRHFIDSGESVAVGCILGVLPLLSKVWYSAYLVGEGRCPEEMAQLYRVNVIRLTVRNADGRDMVHELLQCDAERFVYLRSETGENRMDSVLERSLSRLEQLRPIAEAGSGSEDFVTYTQRYAELERDCMILSIKPDVHFNLVPTRILYPAIRAGFEQAGMAEGAELALLMQSLEAIHDARIANMYGKRRPTHIVYSLQAMEQFMRTGVQSDQFFLQRAYTVEERRQILRCLLQQMQDDPYFHVCFLRPELPEIRSEMTLYDGKGVLLMDAYTSYDLHDDHSEALITLPGFRQSFRNFFLDVLLNRFVLSRQESIAQLERLLQL